MNSQKPSFDEARFYLAALIDGEGCLWSRADGRRSSQLLTITICDKEIRDFAEACFTVLSIRYRLRDWQSKGRNKNGKLKPHRWNIEVARADDFRRAQALIPIQHKAKAAKFLAALEVCKPKLCGGCGCLQDESTVGCSTCHCRHSCRRKAARKRAKNAIPTDLGELKASEYTEVS